MQIGPLNRKALLRLARWLISIRLLVNWEASVAASDKMLINLSQHANLIYQLITFTASFIGFLFIFRALLKLKIYGEMRTMMSPHARLNQIIILLFAGVLLVYFSMGTVPVLMDAVFGSSEIKELAYDSKVNFNAPIQMAAKRIIQVMGGISLVRGIIHLAGHQEGGGRNPIGKALTHIVSGILAINVQQTIDLVADLVGN